MNSDKAYVKKVEEVNEEDIYDMLHEVEESNKTFMDSRDMSIEDNYQEVIRCLREKQYLKNSLHETVVSLITSVAITVGSLGGFLGITSFIGSKFKQMPYTTLTYNEETGYSKDSGWIGIKNGKNETYIKVYEPWNMQNEREVKVYDVSSLDDMELAEYLKLNLEEMGIDYTTVTETLRGYEVFLNDEEVKEVVKTFVYPEEVRNNRDITFVNVIVLGMFFLYCFLNLLTGDSIFMSRVDDAIYKKRHINCCGGLLSQYDLRSMLEYSVQMTDMIKRNEKLRNKFVKEVNRLKCSDPSEIMEEFKRVCSEVDTSSLSDKYNKMVKTLKYSGE